RRGGPRPRPRTPRPRPPTRTSACCGLPPPASPAALPARPAPPPSAPQTTIEDVRREDRVRHPVLAEVALCLASCTEEEDRAGRVGAEGGREDELLHSGRLRCIDEGAVAEQTTVSTVSAPPRAAESAVVSTTLTPWQAAASEGGSLRSPNMGCAPSSTRGWSSEPGRTRMRTTSPRARRRRAIRPPSWPVAPATRITGSSLRGERALGGGSAHTPTRRRVQTGRGARPRLVRHSPVARRSARHASTVLAHAWSGRVAVGARRRVPVRRVMRYG